MVEQTFLTDKKILITGVAGQIGRGLAYVLARNNEVHGADVFTDPKIKEEQAHICSELHTLDLSSAEDVAKLPRDYDVVFNLAVLWGSAPREEKTWNLFVSVMRVNSFLPGRLMMHYRDTGVKLVFGSTGGLYIPCRDRNDLCVEGQTCWEGGGNVYEDGKMGNDIIVSWLSEDYGVPSVIVRYYWPASPYRGGGRAGQIARDLLNGQPVKAAKERPWWHNVGYISNLVYPTIAAANFTGCPAPFYNVTGEEITSSYHLTLNVAEQLGVEPKIEEVDDEGASMYVADVSKMKRDLWVPRVGVQEYIKRAIRGIKENTDTPADWMFE